MVGDYAPGMTSKMVEVTHIAQRHLLGGRDCNYGVSQKLLVRRDP